MRSWPQVITERADIVILRAPEAWRNYNLAISQREGYLKCRNHHEASRMDRAARLSLEVYFARIEAQMAPLTYKFPCRR